ncbi:ABC transporter permease [Paenibacillus planticolens]|uniref:ABC transporter permease subunit n=1 Tax=Paenibacillus planticolens TaxID=2654976 RepID=A0ABX1ZY47_9BACL|nr:ABC transporter permease [Paenibacillus planticolens]NOV04793.1 ABC transporter permease subunit [Paenibacillus planticolens]
MSIQTVERIKASKTGIRFNRRQRTLMITILATLLVTGTWLCGFILSSENLDSHLELRNLAPSWEHPFGTDWLGRDMFTRTIKGLSLSIRVGMTAAASSVLIAAALGLAAATMGKTADRIIAWLIDLFLGVPHLVTLILIAFVLGGGMKGVIIGVALTHWPSLARVIRAEVMQLRSAEYVLISLRLGKSRWWVATRHMLPHLIPQLLVGLLLLFPHAILHEASITFIGMGLSPHQPAIGIILSESMRYLSAGMWWLAIFPGLCLLIVVRAFDIMGENLRMLVDPHRSHE